MKTDIEIAQGASMLPISQVAAKAGIGEEGYDEIAAKFELVAGIEQVHEARYVKLRENIENDVVFKNTEVTVWKCRECGNIHVGKEAPEICPVCSHPQAYYEIKAENY